MHFSSGAPQDEARGKNVSGAPQVSLELGYAWLAGPREVDTAKLWVSCSKVSSLLWPYRLWHVIPLVMGVSFLLWSTSRITGSLKMCDPCRSFAGHVTGQNRNAADALARWPISRPVMVSMPSKQCPALGLRMTHVPSIIQDESMNDLILLSSAETVCRAGAGMGPRRNLRSFRNPPGCGCPAKGQSGAEATLAEGRRRGARRLGRRPTSRVDDMRAKGRREELRTSDARKSMPAKRIEMEAICGHMT